MGRTVNKAIPQDGREWPPYQYQEYPKWMGKDEQGNPILAHSKAEEEALKVPEKQPEPEPQPEIETAAEPVETPKGKKGK